MKDYQMIRLEKSTAERLAVFKEFREAKKPAGMVSPNRYFGWLNYTRSECIGYLLDNLNPAIKKKFNAFEKPIPDKEVLL